MQNIENYLKINKDCTIEELFKAFKKVDSVTLMKDLIVLVKEKKVIKSKKDDWNVYNLA
jgi:DeoR/GlpR family transcriptional regulator of sugar metabolism